ncbi:uncharacterized protein LOC134786813 [Penaeus indicus]|uniref:uncharacterized protein LOC134786813 n=1 Tax=Penaeus indicus TaxID=29960 RepID=UPI00300D2F60
MLTWLEGNCDSPRGQESNAHCPRTASMVPPAILHSNENLLRRANPVLSGGHAFKRVQRRSESEGHKTAAGPYADETFVRHTEAYGVARNPDQSHLSHLQIYPFTPTANQCHYTNQSSDMTGLSNQTELLNNPNPMILTHQIHNYYGYGSSPTINECSLDGFYFSDLSGAYGKYHIIPGNPKGQIPPACCDSKAKGEWHEPVRPYPLWKPFRPTRHSASPSPNNEESSKDSQSISHVSRKKGSSVAREDQNAMDLVAAMKASFRQDRRKSPVYDRPLKILTDKELKTVLKPNDYNELMGLIKLNLGTLTSNLHQHVGMDTIEGLGELYSQFVERRTHFFTKIPFFKQLCLSDKPRLLRLAVAISTHISAAQHIDASTYTWPRSDASQASSCLPILSASTLRQIVTHEHFLAIMKFYTNYCHIYADPNASLLTEVLSLFYDEPGLSDPRSASTARSHYLALLSRYLIAVHGWQRGSDILKVIISSQREARQLTEIHQYVEFRAQPPRQSLTDVTNSLAENFVKMRVSVQDTISKHISQQQQEQKPPCRNLGAQDSLTPSERQGNEAAVFSHLLSRLATCDDPEVLAAAKHHLPTSLLLRFLHLLE